MVNPGGLRQMAIREPYRFHMLFMHMIFADGGVKDLRPAGQGRRVVLRVVG